MITTTIVLSFTWITFSIDTVEYMIIPIPFSVILNRISQNIDVDSIFKAFVILFLLQVTMLSGFILYCDCPWNVYLDIKITMFYLTVCHVSVASNYLYQLLCFEIIGILSFRLIGHYLDRINAIRGAHIAIGTNRIADVVLALIFVKCTVFVAVSWQHDPVWLDVFILSLAVKSISVISFMWLPDAMEGPTPVSALLHSATLVIAGVIIYSRASSSYQYCSISSLLIVGSLLVILSYNNDPDSKKCAAISTCIMISMLWIELLTSSSGSWVLAITHANYKSTLFVLLAYILAISGTQDVRAYNWSSTSIANIAVLCILVYSINIPGTSYAYAKLGTKLLCHSSYSTFRIAVSMLYMITTMSLYIVWVSFFIITASNDSNSNVAVLPVFVIAWCLMIVISITSQVLPTSISTSSIISSSIVMVISLISLCTWFHRNSLSWSFMITNVHFSSSFRSMHASVTYFSWIIPYLAISRASFRTSFLLIILILCLS